MEPDEQAVCKNWGLWGLGCPSGMRLELIGPVLDPHLGVPVCGPAWSQAQFNRDLRSKGKHRIQPAGRPRGVDDVAVPGGGSQGSFGSS